MEKHDVDSPWYKKCVEAGAGNVDALEEIAVQALEDRISSRSYFASLWSLRFDASQRDKATVHPELSNSDLLSLARGLVLLEKRLREKSRSYTFGSASPVIPVCRFLEYRFLPEKRDALDELYVWIHSHKEEENPYTPFGALAYSDCITFDEKEAVDRAKAKRRAVHERTMAEQKYLSKQRRRDDSAARQRKREKRNKTSDVIVIDYGEEGIYISKSWVKRYLNRLKNIWRKIRSRYGKKQ